MMFWSMKKKLSTFNKNAITPCRYSDKLLTLKGYGLIPEMGLTFFSTKNLA